MNHITIVNPGKTTFKQGEVISQEAFDKENERVSRLGKKTARGMYFNEAGESIDAVYSPNGNPFIKEFELVPGDRVRLTMPAQDPFPAGWAEGEVIKANFYGERDGWFIELTKDKVSPGWQTGYGYWKQGIDKGTVEKLSGTVVPDKSKPTRDDVRVEVWEERDRLHIGIQDKETGDYYQSWWDDEARQMFEDGFFKREPNLEESVLDYAEKMGILKK